MTTEGRRGDAGESRRHLSAIGLSGVYAAAVSYVVLVLAAHSLTPADNAVFLAYWALLFAGFGVFSGVQAEATRSTLERRRSGVPGAGRLVPFALLFTLGVGAVIGASSPLWAQDVLGGRAWLTVIVLAACVVYAVHLALAGVLAAEARWRGLMWAILADASVRLVAVVAVVGLGASVESLAVASAGSTVAWLLLLGRHDVRAGLRARGADVARAHLSHLLQACVATGSSAALLVGFPVLVRLTTTDQEYLGAAGLLLAITLTRAPLMVPLTAYQGVLLRQLMSDERGTLPALRQVAGVVLAVTAVGALIAGSVGPWVYQLVLGDRYQVGGLLLLALTVAAGLLALLTLSGAACLAMGRHWAYASGWVVATCGAAGVLLLVPGAVEVRSAASLLLAPVMGSLVHTWFLRGGRVTAKAAPAVMPWTA